MTTQPSWTNELERRAVPARLQPMPLEKAADVLSLEWGVGGFFDARVEKVFKVRCLDPCRGHVGYVTVVAMTPEPGVTSHTIASFAEEAANTDVWIDRQDERWREKYQVTGRKRIAASIPGGGQRWAQFVPLPGWKIEGGLWKLTARAREQQQRGNPMSGRRIGGPFKHMREEQLANNTGNRSQIGSAFAADLRRSTMIPDFGQPMMGNKLRLFPQYGQCVVRGCHRILRIKPNEDLLD